jgi:hypothetical protein
MKCHKLAAIAFGWYFLVSPYPASHPLPLSKWRQLGALDSALECGAEAERLQELCEEKNGKDFWYCTQMVDPETSGCFETTDPRLGQ